MNQDPFALPAFVLSIISLALASIGAVTGVVAFVWQFITRTRGAHRIRVKASSTVRLLNGGVDDATFVKVDVMNRGASGVQITNWAIDLPKPHGSLYVVPGDAHAPATPLPHFLEAGTTIAFYARAAGVWANIDERGIDASKLRAVVDLGTGQVVFGKRREFRR